MDLKTRNDYLLINIGNILKNYFLYTLIFFTFRLFFIIYFGDNSVYSEYKFDLLKSLYVGWKYDNIVISYLFTLPVLFSLILSFFKAKKIYNIAILFQRLLFFIGFVAVTLLLISDMGFYLYFQDHLNILFFGIMEDDTWALLQTVRKDYPFDYIVLAVLLFFGLIFKLINKLNVLVKNQNSMLSDNILMYAINSIVVFLLLVGGLRGGYSDFVLAPKYSDFSDNEFINQVSVNGIITFENAWKLRQIRSEDNISVAESFGYTQNMYDAFKDYLNRTIEPKNESELVHLLKRKTSKKLEDKKYNVVVFLMESFGGHWLQYNSESFDILGKLKPHFESDYLFKNFISDDNGTIGSLMAVGTNIPNRPGARYLSESKYMQLPLESAAHIPFQKNGYETYFYYGGKLGWRDIGKYFRYQGVKNIRGENFIQKHLQLSGRIGTEWGVFDEHFFNSIYSELASGNKPKFILGLSTTNHPPFEVPASYASPKIKLKGEIESKISRERSTFLDRMKTFEYSNSKLAEFIEKVKNSPLAKNTIIAVTGDHNFWGFMNYDKKEVFQKHTVPFYLYIPDEIKPNNFSSTTLGSHKDIMTTLYELSLSETEYLSFGDNLFGEGYRAAFNTNLFADKLGVYYKNDYYNWSKAPIIDDKKSDQKNLKLEKKYKSTLSVADFYLRYIYKMSKSVK